MKAVDIRLEKFEQLLGEDDVPVDELLRVGGGRVG